MKWIYKALLQKSFGIIPFGSRINYIMQRYITKTLPVDNNTFYEKAIIASKHLNIFFKYSETNLKDAEFFEFGAGWDLLIPFNFFMQGVKNQTVIDIRKNIKTSLVNNSIRRLRLEKDNIEKLIGKRLIEISKTKINDIKDLNNIFGIDYKAPINAENTHFDNESFDFISNTSTLEHIPANNLKNILIECHRILKKNGIISSLIDLKDHYSYFDSSISNYNFLKFNKKTWWWLNHKMQFQNRIRNSEYVKLFKEIGFDIVLNEPLIPSDEDLKILQDINLNKYFHEFSLDDLGVKLLWLVGKK